MAHKHPRSQQALGRQRPTGARSAPAAVAGTAVCVGSSHLRTRRYSDPALLPEAATEAYTAHGTASLAVQFNGVYPTRVAPDPSMPSQRVR